MKPEFRAAIEQQYSLKIKNCADGPRQFVAETHIIETESGEQYFCKLTDKPLFIQEIIKGISLIAEIHDHRIDRICYPIKNSNGLYTFVSDTLIVLYNYIPAQQSYDYSVYAFGQLMGHIHDIAAPDAPESAKEDFAFPYQKLFDKSFDGTLASQAVNSVTLEFQKLLQQHEIEIRDYISEYHRLAMLCKKKSALLVITHGDAPGNVLMKSPDDIYIIDWDEAMLAAAERDIWVIDHIPEFMEGYKSVRPDFKTDADLRSFYTLKYYFQRSMHYFSEILKDGADDDYRMGHVHKLAHELSQGWMLPRLQEVKENRDKAREK